MTARLPLIRGLGLVAVVGALAVSAARADVIYQTEDPFGGFLGIGGFDVFERQSVGLRITPDADYTLDVIRPWFMNNDDSGQHFGLVTVTLRDDNSSNGQSVPGDTIYESWTFEIQAIGWDPIEEELVSQLHPLLSQGVNYWIVAECDDPPFVDPVWNWASEGVGFMAFTDSQTGEWQPGGMGGVAAITVEATPAGAGVPGDLNCDGTFDGADIDPFFLALGDPDGYADQYPDCDALLGDMNEDGAVDGADIDPFFECLGGGNCP